MTGVLSLKIPNNCIFTFILFLHIHKHVLSIHVHIHVLSVSVHVQVLFLAYSHTYMHCLYMFTSMYCFWHVHICTCIVCTCSQACTVFGMFTYIHALSVHVHKHVLFSCIHVYSGSRIWKRKSLE